ncbi:MAG TPA: hypothetical protein VKF14_13005 [Candidatus Dormibacteraeota bacterium]|nr:hypothetical protein [Candidatus Dormibacteraeota bacterium]
MGAPLTSRARHRNVEVAARRTGEKVVVAGVSTLAVLVAAAGFVVLGSRLSDSGDGHGHHAAVSVAGADPHGEHAGARASTVYEAGGMQLTVQDVGWMSHDMFGGPAPAQNNFPMPAQMMPGMQSDDVNRLHVELTVTNRKDTLAPFRRSNFAVESPQGKRWGANPGDPQNADVPAGASMSIDLYFDVPLQERVANILFANGGGLVRIPFQGGEPQHKHG